MTYIYSFPVRVNEQYVYVMTDVIADSLFLRLKDTRSLTELIASIIQRVGDDLDRNNFPQILYEDEDHDKVVLASDNDLATAVDHARTVGWKGLRLHLEYSGTKGGRRGFGSLSGRFDYYGQASDARAAAYSAVAAGAALVAGLGILTYLKRSGM
ncbi:hypothetical protein CRG98_026303 [Punica granatum]|uniref:PB1 domain-containing protein n=1 Tax=Punica granatum TaxID=22663 RepID=A0A2I0JAJ1_PUNGR|nr:hypothetical protein CRG98_026303 [Punica granatum]